MKKTAQQTVESGLTTQPLNIAAVAPDRSEQPVFQCAA
jgi:hypothetical protein